MTKWLSMFCVGIILYVAAIWAVDKALTLEEARECAAIKSQMVEGGVTNPILPGWCRGK